MAHGCTYCTDDFHCEKFTNEKCTSWCYGDGYPCKDRRISNADRIRGMSDDELAEWLCDIAGWLPMYEGKMHPILEWLEQEVVT